MQYRWWILAVLLLSGGVWWMNRTDRRAPARSTEVMKPPATVPRLRRREPTPGVFDVASIPRSKAPPARDASEEMLTDSWLSTTDLQHPEIYFELAERIPDMNRPDQRQATLTFFLAYRARLQRDLDALPQISDARTTLTATVERYDTAIDRLRKIIDDSTSPTPTDYISTP